MLHIVKNNYFLTDFLFEDVTGLPDVRLLSHRRRPVPPWRRAMKPWSAARPRPHGCGLYFDDDYLAQLRAIRPADDVLFFDVGDLKDLLILRSAVATERPWLWLWNPLRDFLKRPGQADRYESCLRREGFRIATFDPQDARDHGFQLLPQVYRDVALPEVSTCRSTDVFFVGREKSRLAELLRWKTRLQQMRLAVDFHIVRDRGVRHTRAELAELTDTPMPYPETLRRIAGARCLLEILQDGQTGLSVRSLEALFLGKKLITNNAGLLESPAYHPDRIFVIGVDDENGLAAFLERPVPVVAGDVLEQFKVQSWIQNFRGGPAREFRHGKEASAHGAPLPLRASSLNAPSFDLRG